MIAKFQGITVVIDDVTIMLFNSLKEKYGEDFVHMSTEIPERTHVTVRCSNLPNDIITALTDVQAHVNHFNFMNGSSDE